MNRLLLLYRPQIISGSIMSILFLWALTSTIFGIMKKDSIIILKINSSGDASLIGEESSEELAHAFARRYVLLMYNYDYLSFEKNIQSSLPILSQKFWDKTKKEVKTSKELIESRKITQTSAIETKISKIAENTYLFATQTTISKEVSGGQRVSENQRFKVKLTTMPVPKTKENPWGLEVSDATEERLL